MFLGIPKGIGIYNVELNMMPIEAEITAYKGCQAFIAVFILKELGREFLIEQSASRPQMIDL